MRWRESCTLVAGYPRQIEKIADEYLALPFVEGGFVTWRDKLHSESQGSFDRCTISDFVVPWKERVIAHLGSKEKAIAAFAMARGISRASSGRFFNRGQGSDLLSHFLCLTRILDEQTIALREFRLSAIEGFAKATVMAQWLLDTRDMQNVYDALRSGLLAEIGDRPPDGSARTVPTTFAPAVAAALFSLFEYHPCHVLVATGALCEGFGASQHPGSHLVEAVDQTLTRAIEAAALDPDACRELQSLATWTQKWGFVQRGLVWHWAAYLAYQAT